MSDPGDLIGLPDGRQLQAWTGGAPDGSPVVFFHGCPDTRHAAMSGDADARSAGVRLVAFNRPGYGGSDPAPSTQTTVADDVAAAADSLGIGAFSVLGMSIGGPYALATAARHPDRVRSAAVVSSIANLPERWLDGSVEEVMERSRPEFEAYVAELAPDDSDDRALVDRFLDGMPAADAALLSATPVAETAASVREALAQTHGFLRDAALSFRPWDFRVEDVRCPTTVFQGRLDTNHPPVNGEALARQLPDGRLVVRPTTHLATLLTAWPQILASLG
ncbi:alpha/beta hydrolase [Nocardioides sp.]|uniref:alpha/beta fold hydrolase n=1 Tax=Nocardioides sp. TaxID=35761 RepID=UPI0031FE4FD7